MPLGLDENFYNKVLPLVVIETVLYGYAFSSDWRTYQVVLGLLGLWWCCAALWVEISIEKAYPGFEYDNPVDPEMKAYRPFCDFAPWAACSKVLMSPPGRFLRYFGIAKQMTKHETASASLVDQVRNMIDVPNPSLGVIFFGCHLFYPLLLIVPFVCVLIPWAFFAACLFVGGMTIWLAYNLAFVLKDFCVVCVSMYVANFALIPMMWGIAGEYKTSLSDFQPFFGDVPSIMLYPFLLMDAVMLVAVVGLYFTLPAHARERSDASYQKLPDSSSPGLLSIVA